MLEVIEREAGPARAVALSIAKLAKLCKVSEQTARRAVHALAAAGELDITRQAEQTGASLPSVLRLPGVVSVAGPFAPVTPGVAADPEKFGAVVVPPYHPPEQLELVPPPARFDPDEGFVTFWSAYCRKVGRMAALRAWRAKRNAGTMPALGLVLERLERWQASDAWTKDGGAFQPHAATWINQERWNDDPPPPAPAHRRTARATGVDDTRRAALARTGRTWNPDEEERSHG